MRVCVRGELLVEVLDAVDVVGSVHSKGDAIQASVAHHAGKAVRVVSLPRRTQDTFHDGLAADVTGLQGVLESYKHRNTQKQDYRIIDELLIEECEKVLGCY